MADLQVIQGEETEGEERRGGKASTQPASPIQPRPLFPLESGGSSSWCSEEALIQRSSLSMPCLGLTAEGSGTAGEPRPLHWRLFPSQCCSLSSTQGGCDLNPSSAPLWLAPVCDPGAVLVVLLAVPLVFVPVEVLEAGLVLSLASDRFQVPRYGQVHIQVGLVTSPGLVSPPLVPLSSPPRVSSLCFLLLVLLLLLLLLMLMLFLFSLLLLVLPFPLLPLLLLLLRLLHLLLSGSIEVLPRLLREEREARHYIGLCCVNFCNTCLD
ncbi:hypothetical protein E2C01_036053 [Portunus trituberculatus]|uniref:Uncharacterized protein n=1 Tax=Portunus trituberculatus TaxID=210409 RepID=A0A5B7F7M8_PORTR|nr:hypothetical protein [Portunus trituberculatus]